MKPSNIIYLGIMFSLNIFLCFAISSSLHNIDLVYNAQRGLIDCNTFMCDDIETIYQRSVSNLWLLFPLEFVMAFSLGVWIREWLR